MWAETLPQELVHRLEPRCVAELSHTSTRAHSSGTYRNVAVAFAVADHARVEAASKRMDYTSAQSRCWVPRCKPFLSQASPAARRDQSTSQNQSKHRRLTLPLARACSTQARVSRHHAPCARISQHADTCRSHTPSSMPPLLKHAPLIKHAPSIKHLSIAQSLVQGKAPKSGSPVVVAAYYF